jgi:hypothetical protein
MQLSRCLTVINGFFEVNRDGVSARLPGVFCRWLRCVIAPAAAGAGDADPPALVPDVPLARDRAGDAGAQVQGVAEFLLPDPGGGDPLPGRIRLQDADDLGELDGPAACGAPRRRRCCTCRWPRPGPHPATREMPRPASTRCHQRCGPPPAPAAPAPRTGQRSTCATCPPAARTLLSLGPAPTGAGPCGAHRCPGAPPGPGPAPAPGPRRRRTPRAPPARRSRRAGPPPPG